MKTFVPQYLCEIKSRTMEGPGSLLRCHSVNPIRISKNNKKNKNKNLSKILCPMIPQSQGNGERIGSNPAPCRGLGESTMYTSVGREWDVDKIAFCPNNWVRVSVISPESSHATPTPVSVWRKWNLSGWPDWSKHLGMHWKMAFVEILTHVAACELPLLGRHRWTVEVGWGCCGYFWLSWDVWAESWGPQGALLLQAT